MIDIQKLLREQNMTVLEFEKAGPDITAKLVRLGIVAAIDAIATDHAYNDQLRKLLLSPEEA